MNLFAILLGTLAWILSESTMERLGWVLLHSLWQFLLIAIVALVVLRVLKRSSASLRYAMSVFTMAACVVLPVATWFSQPTGPAAVVTEVRQDAITPLPMESMPSPLDASDEVALVGDGYGVAPELPAISNQPSVESSDSVTESSDWWMNARESLRPWLMSIVTVWIVGVMICAMRPLLSWIAIRRWRRVGTARVNQDVNDLMLRLSDRLDVGRTVEILQSSLVHVPLVFGCLRPLILLPASLVTNLPTSQLEAIIAHELAHVRRHDFLVNFMQTIIETLFFYHPAIWWLSRCIRIERENCCDDLVVSVLCNRVDYGRALLAVEENLGYASTLALGARGGSLLARVQRIAGLEAARSRPAASMAAIITSGLLFAGTAFTIGSLLLAAGDDNGSLFGKESNGLQIRLVPLSPDVSDETPELQKIASSFKRSQEMTFAVQLKNVSREPIALAGIRYGDGYAPETQGKLNTAMLAPHWFEFEFIDMDGKRFLRTPHREFYQGWHGEDHSSVHVLAPGESLIEVLRPAKFMQPMDYDLLPGKYRVQLHYRGPNDSLREFVRKHWPNKPIVNAWPHHATSNVSDFSIEEASNRTKPEELIWGKPVEGLQAALEYRLPDDAKGNPLIAPGISIGSHFGITFHLRNVSDKPITFVSETGRQGDDVHVTDESGKEVEVKNVFFSGWPIDVAWKLLPGEVAQLSLLTPGLGSLDKPGKYKVRYTIRFNSRSQKDEAGNIIFPRPGDYDKEVDTGETPLFLHESNQEVSARRSSGAPISGDDTGTKLLKPEEFGLLEEAKADPTKSENREQIGTVQGKPVYRDEIVEGNLVELFTKPIWRKYKEAHREAIEPTEKELELARSYMSREHRVRIEKEGGEAKLRERLKAIEDKLSSGELNQATAKKLETEHTVLKIRIQPPDPSFANFILDNWKLQKHLYEHFGGGRILWQQAGQEAFDATRNWLEFQEKNGEFQITDPNIRAQFYQYWNQDHGSFLTSDKERIRQEFLQPPWIAVIPVTDEQSQKIPWAASTDMEKTVLDILRKPFIDDPAKGTWQLAAHDIDVHGKLSDLPQRTEVILTLFKVVDRTVPSTMHERRLAMEFLGRADPTDLVPRLNKEIEDAIANPAKPFAAQHEIEMLGRMGEDARSSLPQLIKLLDSPDGVAYNLALESLVKIGARSPDVMNELAKHTDDPLTVYQLGRYGQMAKVHGTLFVRLLDSSSSEIHTWAAHALVRSGFDETRGFNVLIADVATGKSENRCRAATALAAMGSQATSMIPRLRPYENDPDLQVAKAVHAAIVRIEKDDRIFTHAEEATKREAALAASRALNPQIQFNLRIVGGEEQSPLAGIEIVATDGYGDSQKKFGPFLTDASGTTVCKLPQGFYTIHLKSKKDLPWLPYEKFWKELPPPGMKTLSVRVTGTGVEKWLGGEVRKNGVEPAKSAEEPARITFTLLKPLELILRAVDIDTGRGLPGAAFYLESAVAEDWAHPIDGANIGASLYRDGEHKFDSHDYQTDAEGNFKRFISDAYLRRNGDSDWGPKYGVWKAPEGYDVVDPISEVSIDLPATNQSRVEQVFKFRKKRL